MAKLYPDLSHYHPVRDWSKAKANCPFMISKATQGTNYMDPSLESFIKGCEGNAIPYWLYAYLTRGDELSQAKFLVESCKGKVGSYFVGYALDVEAGNTAPNVKSALDYLAGLGGKTMVYTMYAQYDMYKNIITSRPADCAFWEARYGKDDGTYKPEYAPHSTADLHQYTSMGSCPGIRGNVDLNRIAGTSKKEAWFTTPKAAAVSADTSDKKKSNTLTVDGRWGTATCKRAQEVFGTTQDGCISGQNEGLKKYHVGVSCAKYAAIGTGSQLIKAIQKKVGTTQDGQLGTKTITAMQKWLGTAPAGYISNPSAMVKVLQTWLNEQ